ncbi:acetylserotonin O-methyltransferase [Streptomyces anulatus]|nr:MULTISPECIES: methyltransferase [Streptomyces]MCX4486292.1 acetylserotonin O-methyltransferase [Streptomyces anulatus]MCX4602862.1 acetylserotonin O-methyltransferase [Streptomyces anulatus]WSI79163.1 acetylserotonin O-methyltransferase [Streptomyces anulatus]WSU75170.1 acetylserotonin O-methyltransferase [Streptomyces anulatus]WTD26464.1 acetylserotonin O-methyltransferase [Streptomyces anulatus]
MSDQKNAVPEPEEPFIGQVMGPLTGFWQTKILLTAVESGLFTELSGSSATAEELSTRLGYRMPGASDFFLALAGMGLLDASEAGEFRNSPAADRYLVRTRPEFIGGYLQFCERELNPAWEGLGTALRTGAPQNPAALEGNPYETLYQDRESTESFLESMDTLNTPLLRRLGEIDWSGYDSFVDVGGARGNVAHHLALNNPHLKGAVFDLPQLEGAFTTHMAALGDDGAVSFHGGDFFAGPLPESDVLIFGHVLHNWGVDERRTLLRKAHDAIRPGGAVIIYDPMVSNSAPPLYATLAALSMLVWSAGGGEYPVSDCHAWLEEAGFRPETVGPEDTPDDVLVIGRKS